MSPHSLDEHCLPELTVEPLDSESSRRLLAAHAPDLVPYVAEALTEAAAGNPLALVELPATLSSAERRGEVPLATPISPGEGISRLYRPRLERLPPTTRDALLVVAASAAEELAPILAACAALGLQARDLEPAEDAGLVQLTAGAVAFTHPLVRGVVLQASTPAQRRRAHRLLAEVVSGEARAWHLAAAALGPDEEAAAALDEAAEAATGRRAYAAAAAACERAAGLTSEPSARARRLLAASEAAFLGGRLADTLRLVERAAGLDAEPALASRICRQQGIVLFWTGKPREAIELLELEAKQAAGRDPEAASLMLADAAVAATGAGDCRRALATARRAARLLSDRDNAAVRAPVLAILGWALTLRGQAAAARGVLEEVERLVPALDPLSQTAQSVQLSLNARLPFEEFERARSSALALAEAAREAGALAAVPYPLVVAVDARLRLGEWDEAEAELEEALRLADETGHGPALLHALVLRVRLAAARGREEESRDACGRAVALAEPLGGHSILVYARAACGFLELGLGRVEEAIASLEELAGLVEASGLREPSLVPWRPDLVEAYVMVGRADDAHVAAHELEREARQTGGAWALAAAARCRGLLARARVDARFEEAIAHHGRRPMPFEQARTLLAYGSRLHRARRRGEARERLGEARTIFEALGAAPWAERAEAELRAAGAVRRTRSRDADTLTPQERRIALAAAEGARNRELATRLFLSEKTIEFHLGNVYRKLGIRSRTQLAALAAAGKLAIAPEEDRAVMRARGGRRADHSAPSPRV